MRCNVCWLQLTPSDRVYATQCSHVLCHDCCTKHFARNQTACPVCTTNLDAQGLVTIDLVPSSEKIKALCGLDPSFILQVASRAIDFYNFQSELAHAHDAQELDSTKHFLHHQTQQHALSQKDLNNQLRTLKCQLEAIVAERDAQFRLVQDLKNRLESLTGQPAPSYSISHAPLSMNSAAHSHNAPSHLVASPHSGNYVRESRHEAETGPTTRQVGYRAPWPTFPEPNIPTDPRLLSADKRNQPRMNSSERRTRIFSSSPAPASSSTTNVNTPVRVQPPPAASPNRANASMNIHSSDASPSSSSSSSSPATRTTSSRFTAHTSAPARPETPLLHRLAGLSSSRHRI